MTTDDSTTTAARGATRRRMLKVTGGLAAAAAAGAATAAGAPSAGAQGRPGAPGPRELITRAVPGTGERLPAVGLGTFTTSTPSRTRPPATSPRWSGGSTRRAAGWSTRPRSTAPPRRTPAPPSPASRTGCLWDEAHALASLERSMERLARGRPLDVVQVHYSVRTRAAEERVLPAAADNGVAVLVNMPLEKGRLHHVVGDREVPGLATEFGAANWAQYFLKWVLGHPAVTAVLPATSNPDHLTQNVGAMRGELPDHATRLRMVRHLEQVPGFDALPTAPWYPGKSYPGLVTRAQAGIRDRSPWWPPAPTT